MAPEYGCAAGGDIGFTNRSRPVRIKILNDPGKLLKFDKGLRGLGSFHMKYSVVNGKLNYNGKRICCCDIDRCHISLSIKNKVLVRPYSSSLLLKWSLYSTLKMDRTEFPLYKRQTADDTVNHVT